MSPRLGALAAVLIVPALPLVAAAPAHAAPAELCVNMPASTNNCGQRFDTSNLTPNPLQDALNAAKGDGIANRIRVGAGDYPGGPYVIDGSGEGLNVVGNNNGTGTQATIVVAPSGATPAVTVDSAALRNMRVQISGAGSTGVLARDGATIDSVIVADTTTAVATNSVGIEAEGSSVVDSTVNLSRGAGNTGYLQTGTTPGSVARGSFRVNGTGVEAQSGVLVVDDTVIDLDAPGGTGLRAGNASTTGPLSVTARHLTVVGGATSGTGVLADAETAGAAVTATLDSSIVRGPANSLVSRAQNGGDAALTVRYSTFQNYTLNGGTIDRAAGNTDADPKFLNAAAGDYSLAAGSPVVDAADPAASTATDNAGNPRVVDGDQNGTAIPDMGAYELQVGHASFTSAPSGLSNNRQPVFQFKGDAPTARFECSLDGGGWQACTSPATTPPLSDGNHSFAVRAVTAAGVVQATPVSASFAIDATAPDTLFTKKPAKRFFKKKVKFKFAASEPGAKFQCQLDGKGWKSCNATWKFNTKVGKHKLLVRAVDAAGNVDASPARYKFKRLKRGR